MNNRTVLVTGGAGFIGSHIVNALVHLGASKIRILDNLATGSISNIQSLLDKYPNIEFILGDVCNLETCKEACSGIDIICHQAALGSVPRSVDNPLGSHTSNVTGFINILVAAKENGIKRIVYASSSSVYGTNNKSIKIEEENGMPISPYAATKYIDEIYAYTFYKTYGLECIGLRYFNIFGPRQNPNGVYAAVIPRFITNILNEKQSTINGDGNNSRDFTYIDNAVQANILALTTEDSKCFGQVFNVGTHNTLSVKDLYYKIKNIMGSSIEPVYGPPRQGDVPYSCASIDKISLLLGYKPTIFFEEGLEKTIEYFKSQNE